MIEWKDVIIGGNNSRRGKGGMGKKGVKVKEGRLEEVKVGREGQRGRREISI